jgi:hypothetical protein
MAESNTGDFGPGPGQYSRILEDHLEKSANGPELPANSGTVLK